MTFLTTIGAFSIYGARPLGNPLFVPTGYIGTGTGYIVDTEIDSTGNIVGCYRDSGLNTYFFEYQIDTTLVHWKQTNNAYVPFNIILDSSDNIYCAGGYNLISSGPTYIGRGNLIKLNSTAVPQFSDVYQWTPLSGSENVPIIKNIAKYGSNIYMSFVKEATVGQPITGFIITSDTGTLSQIRKINYSGGFPTTLWGINIVGATSTGSFWLTGSYTTYTDPSSGGVTYSYVGLGNSTLASGTGRLVNFDASVIRSNDWLYSVTGYSGYVRIIALDTSYNIQLNVAGTLVGFGQGTAICIDSTNSYIYVAYTDSGATYKEKISKFSISGTHIWTRTLTRADNSNVGIKKLMASTDGTKYFAVTDTEIFEFPSNGDIPGGGIYNTGTQTYRYRNDNWSSTTQSLTLTASSTWTSSTVTASETTQTTPTATNTTPLINWLEI